MIYRDPLLEMYNRWLASSKKILKTFTIQGLAFAEESHHRIKGSKGKIQVQPRGLQQSWWTQVGIWSFKICFYHPIINCLVYRSIPGARGSTSGASHLTSYPWSASDSNARIEPRTPSAILASSWWYEFKTVSSKQQQQQQQQKKKMIFIKLFWKLELSNRHHFRITNIYIYIYTIIFLPQPKKSDWKTSQIIVIVVLLQLIGCIFVIWNQGMSQVLPGICVVIPGWWTRDPQGHGTPLMVGFPYQRPILLPHHSHIFRDSYGSGIGIVWERVPLLGVPENPTDALAYERIPIGLCLNTGLQWSQWSSETGSLHGNE